MELLDCILKKRNGSPLTKEEIHYIISGVTQNQIADYQLSALLMAIYFQGMDERETSMLTEEMAHSGDMFDLSSIPGVKVDKHSTGGVADTTTLILAPLVASCGAPVVKMSGKGLGFSGGTIDKLQAIPGFQTQLTHAQTIQNAKQCGLVLLSQSQNLTPADQKLYALRDVTGTVESIPLIASSILSKKIAAGADAIVLDVKCGSGAFMKDLNAANALAKTMAALGHQSGRRILSFITSMEQPLGTHIGNSLEVIEAMEVLKGNAGGDLLTISLHLGSAMLVLANIVKTMEEGKDFLLQNIKNGKGLAKWKECLQLQQADPRVIDDYSLLPQSACQLEIKAETTGYVKSIHTETIGLAAQTTGAGRKKAEDTIDYGAGILLPIRIGDRVRSGEVMATVFASSEEKCLQAEKMIRQSILLSDTPQSQPKLILDSIETNA